MKQETCLLSSKPVVTSVVTILHCPRELRLDPEPLMQIFAEQGEFAAEETVCRALEDLARRINALKNPQENAEFDNLSVRAKRISAIAGQIGLVEVAVAAEGLAQASGQSNGVAVEATMARLERGYDTAISQVWNFRALV